VRRAFYLSYDDTNCEYLTGEEIEAKLDAGIDVVSATFVTPYPPGFPVLVPGQVVSRQILAFIRDLDTPEIHGYKPDFGYRVYTEKAIEMCRPAGAPIGNGHRSLPAESPEPAPAPA
jgi:arginine decarboxylase